MSEALKIDDAKSAAVATHPRVTLASMEAKIDADYYIQPTGTCLTICILVMKNGFYVVGESAPASPENFNAELGQQFARDNAIRQLWKLEGYALRDRLAAQTEN